MVVVESETRFSESQRMEEAQTPNSQSEQAYRALQRLLSRHTAESPVESYVRAIEATNRVHLALMHQRSEVCPLQ